MLTLLVVSSVYLHLLVPIAKHRPYSSSYLTKKLVVNLASFHHLELHPKEAPILEVVLVKSLRDCSDWVEAILVH